MLKGHLDAIVLAALEAEPAHGYAIIETIKQRSAGTFDLPEGTVYPALYRLERKGFIEAEWGVSETGREVKFYRLTTAGRARLKVELAQWTHFTTAVAKVLYESR